MPRALIFVQFPHDLKKAEKELCANALQRRLLHSSGIVIESVQYVFGAFHFVISALAPSWADTDRGVLELQDALNTLMTEAGGGRCATTTVIGTLTQERDVDSALRAATDYHERRSRIQDSDTKLTPNDVAAALAVEFFVQDRLAQITKVLELLDPRTLAGLTNLEPQLLVLASRVKGHPVAVGGQPVEKDRRDVKPVSS